MNDDVQVQIPRRLLSSNDEVGTLRQLDGRIVIRPRQFVVAALLMPIVIIIHLLFSLLDGMQWWSQVHRPAILAVFAAAAFIVLKPWEGVDSFTWLWRGVRWWKDERKGLHRLAAASRNQGGAVNFSTPLFDPLLLDMGPLAEFVGVEDNRVVDPHQGLQAVSAAKLARSGFGFDADTTPALTPRREED